MPGRKTRKDNPEPSVRRKLHDARREHVPTPEGKMCSDLHGNVQRLTETFNPTFYVLYTKKYMKASNKL